MLKEGCVCVSTETVHLITIPNDVGRGRLVIVRVERMNYQIKRLSDIHYGER